MRAISRKSIDEWIPNYYPARAVDTHRVVRISRTGRPVFLSLEENAALEKLFMHESLFEKLEKSGHILTDANAGRVLSARKEWLKRSFEGPQLHIITVTKRCNLACTYCHMNPLPVSSGTGDMTTDTARAVARFIASSPGPQLNVEFQGGEPFLNFEAVRATVEALKGMPAAAPRLAFSIVSNLLSIKPADLEYCAENKITISYTLNGPGQVHDRFRVSASGKPTFTAVRKKAQELRQTYPSLLSAYPLCVLDENSLRCPEDIVDFFYSEGFEGMAVLRLKPLGFARSNHPPLNIDRYMDGYLRCLDRIVEINTHSPRPFSERMVHVALSKIFSKVDVGYVDWRNPCGDVLGALCYDVDGVILPNDDARSLRDHLKIGDVHTDSYEGLIERDETFETANASLRDQHAECRNCAFNPYCGVNPVIHFARSGSLEVPPVVSEDCVFTTRLLDWIFRHLAKNAAPLLRMIPGLDDLLHVS